MIVSDNGTELTSNAVLAWCGEIGVEWTAHCPVALKARLPQAVWMGGRTSPNVMEKLTEEFS